MVGWVLMSEMELIGRFLLKKLATLKKYLIAALLVQVCLLGSNIGQETQPVKSPTMEAAIMADECNMCDVLAAADRGMAAWDGDEFTDEDRAAYLEGLRAVRASLSEFVPEGGVRDLLDMALESEIAGAPRIVVRPRVH